MRERIVRRLLQRYWRWQRGLTLGARGIVIDGQGRFLLVRHTYVPGWSFPGGGVEFGETVVGALERELAEETNILLNGQPELFGIYSNASFFPGDHVALFVVRNWHQPQMPEPNHEISGIGFFASSDLPPDTTPGTRRRIDELNNRLPPSAMW